MRSGKKKNLSDGLNNHLHAHVTGHMVRIKVMTLYLPALLFMICYFFIMWMRNMTVMSSFSKLCL